MAKRWSKLPGKPLDRTQYDKELLEKQLDLETIRVTLTKTGGKEILIKNEGQCGQDHFKRTTTREPNEEGRYRRLIKELDEIANQYGIALDEIMSKFESVSCSKHHLRKLLEKESFTIWTSMDDLGLKNEDSPEYAHLLKARGPEEVERRKTFLGIC